MVWSVGRRPPPESDLIDVILLAAGKALYLANSYEAKLAYVLQVAKMYDLIKANPGVSLEELALSLPPKKMLGRTLKDLGSRRGFGSNEEEGPALLKARDSRNYLAHKGATALGELRSYAVPTMLEALRDLRAAVADIAGGDNIVSSWIFQFEEPREPLPDTSDYPHLVDRWIFGHIPSEWLDAGWDPRHEEPRTLIAAMSYEPWYERVCNCRETHMD